MTTLDGGVIIKKGTAPAPPSGGESGGSDWHYFDVSALDLTDANISMYINTMLMMVRFETVGKVVIGSAGYYNLAKAFAGGNAKVLAFGLDFTQRMIQDGVAFSYKEVFEQAKNSGIILTEITEAEFYDLNA